MVRLLLIVALLGIRIGDAIHPGPSCLDDPEFQGFDEDVNDDWYDEPPTEATTAAAELGQELEVVAFIRATKFQGSKSGMAFKRGQWCQGYYADTEVRVIELAPEVRPLLQVRPVMLNLDMLVPSGLASPLTTDSAQHGRPDRFAPEVNPPATAPRGGGRQARRRPRQPRRSESDAYVWPNDGSLATADANHRASGLWAVDSVNFNAWPGGLEYLRRSAADFLVMQETKVAAGDAVAAAAQTARNSKWSLALAPCRVTDCGGKSSGVAVATWSHIGLADSEPAKLSQDLHQTGRCCKKSGGHLQGRSSPGVRVS